MLQGHPLRRLMLLHDLIFVLLVILAAAAGGYGIHQWHAAASESDRISKITQEIQQTRGELYRQIKELFDAQFLGDSQAESEYNSYADQIESRLLSL